MPVMYRYRYGFASRHCSTECSGQLRCVWFSPLSDCNTPRMLTSCSNCGLTPCRTKTARITCVLRAQVHECTLSHTLIRLLTLMLEYVHTHVQVICLRGGSVLWPPQLCLGSQLGHLGSTTMLWPTLESGSCPTSYL